MSAGIRRAAFAALLVTTLLHGSWLILAVALAVLVAARQLVHRVHLRSLAAGAVATAVAVPGDTVSGEQGQGQVYAADGIYGGLTAEERRTLAPQWRALTPPQWRALTRLAGATPAGVAA